MVCSGARQAAQDHMLHTTVPSSRCSFFSDGKIDDSSCRMMEALMYGTMPAGRQLPVRLPSPRPGAWTPLVYMCSVLRKDHRALRYETAQQCMSGYHTTNSTAAAQLIGREDQH